MLCKNVWCIYASIRPSDQEPTDKAAFPTEGALCAAFKKLEVILWISFNFMLLFKLNEWITAHFACVSVNIHSTNLSGCVLISFKCYGCFSNECCSDAPLVCVPGSRRGLIWCFCFPGSHWRERASSSPSAGERSRPSVSRRGSRCGRSTLKGLYWACSRPPAWPPNRN